MGVCAPRMMFVKQYGYSVEELAHGELARITRSVEEAGVRTRSGTRRRCRTRWRHRRTGSMAEGPPAWSRRS